MGRSPIRMTLPGLSSKPLVGLVIQTDHILRAAKRWCASRRLGSMRRKMSKAQPFLSSWPSDQRQFPKLEGYLPAFKRVRRFPTNQRFEPLIPGATWYLSDAWGAGDPWLTWGNFKIVHRGPMVGPAGPGNFNSKDPNWKRERVGGPQGGSFIRSDYEVIPDLVVIETEPTGFPRRRSANAAFILMLGPWLLIPV